MDRFALLPTELVLEIPQHLDALSDLAALARTCRSFYQALNQVLYRRDVESGDPVSPFWGAEKGVVNTLHHANVAGADLSRWRQSSQPWSDMLPSNHAHPQTEVPPADRLGASFLERGGDHHVPQAAQYWWHPLDVAALFGHAQAVRYLASAGVDVASSTSRGLCKFQCIPEMAAADHGGRIPIGRPFDWAIHTALQMADCAGQEQAARALRELGGGCVALPKSKGASLSSERGRCGSSCGDARLGGRQKVLAESPPLFSFYDFVLERF
ncbi:hypothetical protein B0H67DRAFT_570751 [Lasiosphaeris hirsuta]|uniref:F-box domain-containing protein n=1 Tax=Lasiosphaeris hirsuta TaxID=260670 RepID=A0AA40B0X0_9PEZI|nr:hypothetical protein B0H67DRAFT_570751 [Lasiosphaeris hirsuta]